MGNPEETTLLPVGQPQARGSISSGTLPAPRLQKRFEALTDDELRGRRKARAGSPVAGEGLPASPPSPPTPPSLRKQPPPPQRDPRLSGKRRTPPFPPSLNGRRPTNG